VSKKFTCGRRLDPFAFGAGEKGKDSYSKGRCSYCGSMSQEAFFEAVEAGAAVGPTDKNYKAYVDTPEGRTGKFYFQHLDQAGRERFIALLNSGQMNIGLPGHFYVLPFFCRRDLFPMPPGVES
jgi:hypothetical protein